MPFWPPNGNDANLLPKMVVLQSKATLPDAAKAAARLFGQMEAEKEN